MPRLRFTKRSDDILRANVKVEFAASLSTLETAVVFAYEHEAPEVALQEIPSLSKDKVVELVEELFKAKGYGTEFIGENTDAAVVAATEKRVQELWPQLSEGLPLSQILNQSDAEQR